MIVYHILRALWSANIALNIALGWVALLLLDAGLVLVGEVPWTEARAKSRAAVLRIWKHRHDPRRAA